MPSGCWRPLLNNSWANDTFSGRPEVAKNACSPGGLVVIGQGGHVDQLLDARDGHLVEGRNPTGESVGEGLDLSVGDEPVHVTVLGGPAGGDVIAAEQDLQRRPRPTRRPSHASRI